MDAFFKIISNLIITLNKIINNLDKKTLETIKKSFYSAVIILGTLAIMIGYFNGKGAAKRTGESIAPTTDSVFDFTRGRERDTAQFRSMLETELINELKEANLTKNQFPSNERLEMKLNNNIIESERLDTKIELPQPDPKTMLIEIDRSEDMKYTKPIDELQRRPDLSADENMPDMMKDIKNQPLKSIPGEDSNKTNRLKSIEKKPLQSIEKNNITE